MIRHYFSTLNCGVAEAGRHRLKQIKLQGRITTTTTTKTTTAATKAENYPKNADVAVAVAADVAVRIERRLWVTLATTRRRRQRQQQQQNLCTLYTNAVRERGSKERR